MKVRKDLKHIVIWNIAGMVVCLVLAYLLFSGNLVIMDPQLKLYLLS